MQKYLFGVAVGLLSAGCFSAHAESWKETSRHVIGGGGGWDLLVVDPTSRRVFITRGDQLMVADVDNGKSIGNIPGLKRAHGVALVPNLKRGFVSSGQDDKVLAFDLITLQPITFIATGGNPDAMVFDSASSHVLAFNGKSNNVTVIDPKKLDVVATIALAGKPELAVSDGHGHVFVNLEDKCIHFRYRHQSRNGYFDLAADRLRRADRPRARCETRAPVLGVREQAYGRHQFEGWTIGCDVADRRWPRRRNVRRCVGQCVRLEQRRHADHRARRRSRPFSCRRQRDDAQRARTITLDEQDTSRRSSLRGVWTRTGAERNDAHPRPVMKPDSFGFVVVGQS